MDTRLAIFSTVQNDIEWPELWIKHYTKQAPAENVYLLDYRCGSYAREVLERLATLYNVNLIRIGQYDNAQWLANTVSDFQAFLLNSYDAVLYTDIDEIIAVHPSIGETISEFADANLQNPRNVIRCAGYEIVHQLHLEPEIDFEKPILQQRSKWYHSELYSKPLLASVPLQWREGFYSAENVPATEVIDNELLLLKMQKIDFDQALLKQDGDDLKLRSRVAAWILEDADYGNSRPAVLSDIPGDIRGII